VKVSAVRQMIVQQVLFIYKRVCRLVSSSRDTTLLAKSFAETLSSWKFGSRMRGEATFSSKPGLPEEAFSGGDYFA
jgi:hypothetical protein